MKNIIKLFITTLTFVEADTREAATLLLLVVLRFVLL